MRGRHVGAEIVAVQRQTDAACHRRGSHRSPEHCRPSAHSGWISSRRNCCRPCRRWCSARGSRDRPGRTARAAAARRSGAPSTMPGSTRRRRASASTCSTRRRYFEQSITSARLTVCPHWLVPPPLRQHGHAGLAGDGQSGGHVVDRLAARSRRSVRPDRSRRRSRSGRGWRDRTALRRGFRGPNAARGRKSPGTMSVVDALMMMVPAPVLLCAMWRVGVRGASGGLPGPSNDGWSGGTVPSSTFCDRSVRSFSHGHDEPRRPALPADPWPDQRAGPGIARHRPPDHRPSRTRLRRARHRTAGQSPPHLPDRWPGRDLSRLRHRRVGGSADQHAVARRYRADVPHRLVRHLVERDGGAA